MRVSDLKPCPFCGGAVRMSKSLGGEAWWVDCRCGAKGTMTRTEAEAIEAWNHRENKPTGGGGGMRFRKRPVVIEAIQLRICPNCGESNFAEVEAFAGEGRVALSSWMGPGGADCEVIVLTMEGLMAAHLGDWIIRGAAGEVYPCKPEIFEQTYEPVEEVEA